MLARLIGVMLVLGLTSHVMAQEAPKYEVLKKMYDDAVASLKASQEAKNQLATKGEELTKQVAELQKQLDAVVRERDELQRQSTQFAERTYQLRCGQIAWQEFLKRYPALQARWKVFMELELLKPGVESPALLEPVLPF